MNSMTEPHRQIYDAVNARALELQSFSFAHYIVFKSLHRNITQLRMSGIINDRRAASMRRVLLSKFSGISMPATVHQRDYELRILQTPATPAPETIPVPEQP